MMPDREKVLKGLECCAQMGVQACRQCPYELECEEDGGGSLRLCADALVLLKEQDSLIEDAKEQGWSDGYNEREREYQEDM